MLAGSLNDMESYDPDCMLALEDECIKCFQSASEFCEGIASSDTGTAQHWHTNSTKPSIPSVTLQEGFRCATLQEGTRNVMQHATTHKEMKNAGQRRTLPDETKHALKRVRETGCLTPLIKEELKCTIQARRLASGKEELILKEEKPRIDQLSDDDIRRRELRKEQNRKAARRYRSKQRQIMSREVQERLYLEAENSLLLDEVKKLRQEKKEIEHVLNEHMLVCTQAETVGNIYSIF